MNSQAQALRDYVQMRKEDLEKAKKLLEDFIRNCEHDWGAPVKTIGTELCINYTDTCNECGVVNEYSVPNHKHKWVNDRCTKCGWITKYRGVGDEMLKLYKFTWDCGRMGYVNGLFAADDATIEDVIGSQVYFGDILGKHSDICGELSADDFKVLTDDQEFIEKAKKYGVIPNGYNPLVYIEFEDEE